VSKPKSVEHLLLSLHPSRSRSDVHDLDSGFDSDAEVPAGAGEQSSSGPAPVPAVQGERGLDMYERDMLETVSRFVEATGLGYHLGAAVERILHAPGQGRDGARTLREAMWLLERHIEIVERRPVGADLHVVSERLARAGDVIAELKALAGEMEPKVEPPRAVAPAAETPVDPYVALAAETRVEPPAEAPQSIDDIIIFPDEQKPEEPAEEAAPLPFGRDTAAAVAPAPTGLSFSSVPIATAEADAEAEEEHYPLHRELAVMAFRWALMVVAVIAIVLVATLIAGWR
jgi:hypothetical protein